MFVNIIILLLAFLNIYCVYLFWENFVNSDFTLKYYSLGLFFIFQVIVTLYAIKVFYSNPILNLELTIKKVLSWKLKDEEIKFNKSYNKHINYITTFFSNTLNTLKNIKEEFLHGKEIKWEVELWKEIQWKSLNKDLIEVPSLNIVAKTKPAWEIGWDSYDVIKSEDNYYIYVWDATGHWVWAWFIMMMVNALVSALSTMHVKWSEILSLTNKILKPRVKANLLMTLLLLRWNEKEKRMFMTWAWHEYLMILKKNKNKCYKIKSGWVALWMIKNISKLIKEQEIEFEPGDIIVLYSDWITEAINKPKRDWTEQMFWEDRLVNAIENSPNVKWENYKSAISVFNNITITLSNFMGYRYNQLDDVTLTVVQYKNKNSNPNNDYSIKIPEDLITEWSW